MADAQSLGRAGSTTNLWIGSKKMKVIRMLLGASLLALAIYAGVRAVSAYSEAQHLLGM